MEANEAPEKIYIVNDDLNIKREWYKTKQVGFETTEYTRTDAFIEKACEWMSSHLQMQYSGFSDFIKDFRKAMKNHN